MMSCMKLVTFILTYVQSAENEARNNCTCWAFANFVYW